MPYKCITALLGERAEKMVERAKRKLRSAIPRMEYRSLRNFFKECGLRFDRKQDLWVDLPLGVSPDERYFVCIYPNFYREIGPSKDDIRSGIEVYASVRNVSGWQIVTDIYLRAVNVLEASVQGRGEGYEQAKALQWRINRWLRKRFYRRMIAKLEGLSLILAPRSSFTFFLDPSFASDLDGDPITFIPVEDWPALRDGLLECVQTRISEVESALKQR